MGIKSAFASKTQDGEKSKTIPIFPFTAIVGQDEMKLALQLNVIDPKIGGVIIMGTEELVNQQQFVQLLIYYQKLLLLRTIPLILI